MKAGMRLKNTYWNKIWLVVCSALLIWAGSSPETGDTGVGAVWLAWVEQDRVPAATCVRRCRVTWAAHTQGLRMWWQARALRRTLSTKHQSTTPAMVLQNQNIRSYRILEHIITVLVHSDIIGAGRYIQSRQFEVKNKSW